MKHWHTLTESKSRVSNCFPSLSGSAKPRLFAKTICEYCNIGGETDAGGKVFSSHNKKELSHASLLLARRVENGQNFFLHDNQENSSCAKDILLNFAIVVSLR